MLGCSEVTTICAQNKITRYLLFTPTTAAMAMEDYCHEQKIPGRLIPLPQEISAGCGLAWRMLPGEYEQEKDRIEKSGIVIESNIIIMI